MDTLKLITSYNDHFDKSNQSSALKSIDFNKYILTKDNITESLNTITSLKTQIADLTADDLSNNHTVISFFKYSLLIYGLYYTLNKNSGYPSSVIEPMINDGLLNKTSGNCLHTILTLKNTVEERRKFNFFVKFVDYEKNNNPNEKTDNILFDIINGHFFRLINSSLNENGKQKLRKHLSLYLYSFLSYYSVMPNDDTRQPPNNYWNYNKLIYEYDKSKGENTQQLYSPYHPANIEIESILKTKNSSSLKPAFIYMTTSIKHVNLYRFLHPRDTNYAANLTKIQNVFKELFFNFFKFLLELGIQHGFHHNDLHSGNLIYNLEKNEITMFDFGRSCFASLLISDNSNINTTLQEKLTILNFKEDTNIKHKYESISTYKDLFDVSKGLLLDFLYVDAYRKTPDNYPYYPMIIFDHMTLALTMYSYFIRYLNNNSNPNFQEFLNQFKKLLEFTDDFSSLNYDNYTINEGKNSTTKLLETYKATIEYLKTIKTSDRHLLNPFINSLKIIADGLLLIGLLELHFGNINNTHYSAIDINTYVVMLNIKEKNKFIKEFLLCFYLKYKDVFVDNDHFLIYILKDKPIEQFSSFKEATLTGGGKKYKKKAGLVIKQQSQQQSSEVSKEPSKIKIPTILSFEEEIIEEFEESNESPIELNKCYIDTYNDKDEINEQRLKELPEGLPEGLPEELPKGLLQEWNKWEIFVQKGGKKKVVNRKIRRLKKYN